MLDWGNVAGWITAFTALAGLMLALRTLRKAGLPQAYAIILGRTAESAGARLIIKNTLSVPILVSHLTPRQPRSMRLAYRRRIVTGYPWDPQVEREWLEEIDPLPIGVTLAPGEEHACEFAILIKESSRSISVRISCQIAVMRRIATTSNIDVIAIIPELKAISQTDV
jgi:hypothetical protein